MKVVINKCFGGFGLSPRATLKLYERGVTEIAMPVENYFGISSDGAKELRQWRVYLSTPHERSFITVFSADEKYVLYAGRAESLRSHPEMIRVVEEMGDAVNGSCAKLEIIEIPDGVDYDIQEYDGIEHIAEKHRTWG
jgi:hypothetical protein